MKRSWSAKRLPLLAAVGLGVSFAAVASARADSADDAFNAWNAAFLVKSGGDTYYATTVTTAGTMRSGTWVGALDIAVAEDVYQRTHSVAARQLVSGLVTTFIAKEGVNWMGDTWDDDIAWMVIAVLRGYQITGNSQLLTVAENNWNMAYNRGWDTKYGGGGVWEDLGHVTPWNQPSKCNLSNNPLIKMGLVLYRITGDATYLDKCKGMYAWIRKTLFDAQTGLVNECLAFKAPDDTTGFVQTSDNAYNSGSFLEAADDLYRATGDQSYLNDAVLAVNHRIDKDPILHDGGQGETQWAYRFVKGLSEFATYHDEWPTYQTWLQNNADAAWNQRDALNITWNDWTKPTPLPGANGVSHQDDVVPLCTSSAAAIWQLFPPASPPPLAGVYELRNSASQLSMAVESASAGAPVVEEPFTGDDRSLWTFVPSGGGYDSIRNVRSGLIVQVAGGSYALGALVVQGQNAPHAQGSDRWLPVAAADGSYSFYNLASAMALDDPAQMVVGTQLDQWSGNDTIAQKFTLIPHVVTSDGGVDADSGDVEASQAGADARPTPVGSGGANSIDGMSGGGGAGGSAGAAGGEGDGSASGAGLAPPNAGAHSTAGGCACSTTPSSKWSWASLIVAFAVLVMARRPVGRAGACPTPSPRPWRLQSSEDGARSSQSSRRRK